MFNATPITLRNEAVYLRELTIGEVIEIAKIPEQMNELRLNAFLSYVCDDNTLPYRLTVQERYYILLNYLAVSNSQYLDTPDIMPFLLDEKTCDDFVDAGEIYVKPIFGNEISTLQKKCENTYEWLAGQMAFGIFGDVGRLLGLDDPIIWTDARSLNDNDLETTLIERFEFIHTLTDSQFETLYASYQAGRESLSHLVEVWLDDDGVKLLANGGGGYQTARFHPLETVSAIGRQLAGVIRTKFDYQGDNG